MKFVKNPNVWFAVVLLFTFIIGPAYVTITDKAEKQVVKMSGLEKVIFVDHDKAIVRYDVLGGGSSLYEKDGRVMKLTTFIPIRRPTLFITTSASADEENIYRQFFTRRA